MDLIIIILAFYIFVYIINKNLKNIGEIGENIVKNKLKNLSNDYMVYNNVRLGYNQIDHLVIHHDSKTIFVIETKTWGGKIIGKYNDKKWIQYKNGRVRFLNNPILQNNRHCYAVRKKYKGYNVHNVVVFVGNKNVPKYRCVINEDILLNYISNKVSNRGKIDMQTDWKDLIGKI